MSSQNGVSAVGDDSINAISEYDQKVNAAAGAVRATGLEDKATVDRIAHQYGVMPDHLSAALTDSELN